MRTPYRLRAALLRTAAVTAAATLALAGCGSGDADDAQPGASPQAGASFPVTVGDLTLDVRPEKIVSLSPTLTEMLFAIDAGDQVAAVDDNSNHPAEAPTTDLSGFTPNVEAIVTYEPDLVVLSTDANGVVAGLERLSVPVYVADAAVTLEDTYRQITELGALTGHPDAAADLADSMRTEIDKLVADAPELAEPLTYYYELDPTFYTVTSQTFVGSLFAMVGLTNIADAADPQGDAGGYPQLSAEALIDADPDLIFLADTKCCEQDAQTVAARAGWSTITAVQAGQVVELDDDIASRWGPRVVDLVRAIVDAVDAATN
ncbi:MULTISPECIES: ABC transporter substrate-binding protein [unclassified Solwaraspora]|uniref:ABC transporter substrate-binding protein n=1 Tax=unclassified Solwaraspora TaxID=2627926 RepID=UPI00259BE5BE|nr:ABC transporter substrate-binding protein [Solwaraspora sp. WMMA2056]WJK41960.1 ABC transporter substrate-binding protein [Solwaraspora sp. WMMA2056]